ncbi:DEAD/DEAH box helicase family protein [Aliarcobacter butzleri]|uniref:DEAD/DEAH box helicase family protein n=1 Tax=Aliarcobacter butzleri TaxID=28197 RepID=UPI00062E62D9|nr:DEAD/DEAH box helicase family protein [Aliarcobacter butzleri]KLD98302.1 hypothetical protein AF74_03555 [Aliarcobacter butzleri L349]
MDFDFASGLVSNTEEILISPEDIFSKMTSGKQLWLGQGDALREWDKERNKSDILLSMDTGMGKTIVGLLISYSLMNERKMKSIYVCASKQLVDQTVTEANNLGIAVASYSGGDFINEFEFNQCKVPLITTYQALFNGKSKFHNEDIGGIVFDDSHVADNILKNCFTLNISKSDNSEIYEKVSSLARPYFESSNQIVRFNQVTNNKSDEVLILPPFELKEHFNEIRKILIENRVEENPNLLFSWEYLKDNLDMCLFLLNQNRIEIMPPIIPSKTLSYFKNDVRRVYLSATHINKDYFPRYYGNKIKKTISFPSGKSKTKKFIISPFKTRMYLKDTQNVRKKLLSVLSDEKALIITPSFKRNKNWLDLDKESIIETNSTNIIEKILEFKSSKNKKLILSNRYDGIDFPGDSCRVLIFDGLPIEGTLLDTYLTNHLKAINYTRNEISSKIIQGIGRIFRGIDDYGIIIFVDKNEINWIYTPRNMYSFPNTLQIQLKVGDQLNQMITNENFDQLISQVLTNKKSLTDAYDKFIDDENKKFIDRTNEFEESQNNMEKISILESKIFCSLWDRDYSSIEELISDLIKESETFDSTINSWHNFLSGMIYQVLGKDDESNEYFYKAQTISKITPKPLNYKKAEYQKSKKELSNNIIELIQMYKKNKLISDLNKKFDYLDSNKYKLQDKKHELGIEALGKYLGYDTERPDDLYKTGPDVLWKLPNNKYVLLELKTNKDDGNYSKKETSQSLDHIEWIKNRESLIDNKNLYSIIIGPHNKVNHDANPSEETYIVALEEFKKYAELLISLIERSFSPSIRNTEQIDKLTEEFDLNWESYFKTKMEKILAIDLK